MKTEKEIKEKIEELKKKRDAHDFRSVPYYRCSAGVHFLEWVLEDQMNNFEKIKAMDIDEMAEFLNNFRRIPKCDYCIYKNDYDDCHADFCYKATKPWLESEVRE